MPNHHRIDEMANTSTAEFHHRTSMVYLECCVSLMLTHMSKQRVVEILRHQARIVQEFD